jgi:hypothetical protein
MSSHKRSRSASPKRKPKPCSGQLLEVLRIYLQHTDRLEDIIVLYQTAKALWPAFANFRIEVNCRVLQDWEEVTGLDHWNALKHGITIETLADWQQFYFCHHHLVSRGRICLWQALFDTLIIYEHWSMAAKFAQELRFTYEDYTKGLILNGKLRVYKTFAKTLSPANQRFLLFLCSREALVTAPVFGRSLFRHVRYEIDSSEFNDYFLGDFLQQTVSHRLLQGVEILNNYIVSGDGGPESRLYSSFFDTKLIHRDFIELEKRITGLRAWGHPKALLLAEKISKHYLEQTKAK